MHGAIAASVVVLPYCDKPDGAHSSTAVGAMWTEMEINPILEKTCCPVRQNTQEGEKLGLHMWSDTSPSAPQARI